MTSNAIARYSGAVTPATRQNLETIKSNFGILQAAMDSVLVPDLHYGVIPGTGQKKPVLLKPGADVLCTLFRLVPDYDVSFTDLGDDHREYTIKCVLLTLDGVKISQGLGLCTTKEKKYRYRTGSMISEIALPQQYWNIKKKNGPQEANHWLKNVAAEAGLEGDFFSPKKSDTDDQWYIAVKAGQVENDCIADVHNTCLKMAKKRALVDAVLTATGAEISFSSEARDFTGNILDVDFEEMGSSGLAPEPEEEPQPEIDVEKLIEELAVKCGLTTAKEKETLRYYLDKTCETTGYELVMLIQSAMGNLDGFSKKYSKWLQANQSKENKKEPPEASPATPGDKTMPDDEPKTETPATKINDRLEAITREAMGEIERQLKRLNAPVDQLPPDLAADFGTGDPSELTEDQGKMAIVELMKMKP